MTAHKYIPVPTGDQQKTIDAQLRRWGIDRLKPVQETIIRQILAADGFFGPDGMTDTARTRIVVLPTGWGKTCCFALPVALLRGPTLIIYPLRSLLFDQARRFVDAGLNPSVLAGGQEIQERQKSLQNLKNGSSRLCLATLETLLSPSMASQLAGLHWSHLVIDEAHVIRQWGSTFRPSYGRMKEILSAYSHTQASAFTATADQDVLDSLREVFRPQVPDECILSPDKSNLQYRCVLSQEPRFSLEYLLRNRSSGPLVLPALVFIRDRLACVSIARSLYRVLGQNVRFYHAGLDKHEKAHTENWFRLAPAGLLVASNAYGLGVDHPGIRTVIHLGLPDSMTSYVQEAGRAGRDGKPALALVIQDENKIPQDRDLARFLDPLTCRRKSLLDAFGFQPDFPCTCDVCSGTVWKFPLEEQAVIDAVSSRSYLDTLQEHHQALGKTLGLEGMNGFSRLINRMLARGRISRSRSPLSWKRLGTSRGTHIVNHPD